MNYNISETGNGLNIIVYGDYSRHNSWKSFATYMSCKRILPDAHFIIALPNVPKTPQFYQWITKTSLKRICFHKHLLNKQGTEQVQSIFLYLNTEKPLLLIRDDRLLLRKPKFQKTSSVVDGIGFFGEISCQDWLGEICCSTNDNQYLPFVFLEDIIGRYDNQIWMENSIDSPFYITNKLKESSLSLNSESVLDFWSSIANIYTLIG